MAKPVVHPLYGVAIHESIASGDLSRMKATAQQAEALLKDTGNVGAALEVLKTEIARLQAAKKKK